MWKVAVLLPQHSPGGTEENHEYLSQDSQSPSPDLNPGPPEYEAEALNTEPQRLVIYLLFVIFGDINPLKTKFV
jgi:hypothetical protein